MKAIIFFVLLHVQLDMPKLHAQHPADTIGTHVKAGAGRVKANLGLDASVSFPINPGKISYSTQLNYGLAISFKIFQKYALGFTFPLNKESFTTHDTYTTLTKEVGKSENKYDLSSYKFDLSYFIRNFRDDRNQLFFTGSYLLYTQIPEERSVARSPGEDLFIEERKSNVGSGIRIIVGVRHDFFSTGRPLRNSCIDAYVSYAEYYNVLHQSFEFNYFGNANPISFRETMRVISIGLRLNYFWL